MKTMFIPLISKRILNRDLFTKLEKELPDKISLFYSIQYKRIAEEVKSLLGKKITHFSQTLGCYSPKITNSESILLISDGKFHATSLAYETKLPVFVFNNSTYIKIAENDLKIIEKNKKTSRIKLLSAKNFGILISNKSGQFKKEIFSLNLKKPTYFFLSNTLSNHELENFDIDCWINSSCPRLDMDLPIINTSELNF